MFRHLFAILCFCLCTGLPGSVSAQQPVAGSPARLTSPVVLPGTRDRAFTMIQGTALDPTNAPLPGMTVRLRNARNGRAADTRQTDAAGLFAFRAVDPGSYVVELLAPDRTAVLASSQLLNLNAGDAVTAIVKLPFRIAPFAGVLGHSTPQAAVITAAAAASGVLATKVTGAVASARQ
jgi:hypothetical protein